jgi:hypothetical protein
MNSHYRKQLVKLFEAKLEEVFPLREQDKEAPIPSGWRIYRIPMQGGINGFIILNIFGQEDRFTLEIAVKKGSLPPPSMRKGPKDDVDKDGVYFRVHKLWSKDGRDHWWWIGPEPSFDDRIRLLPGSSQPKPGLKAVDPAVDSAIKAVRDYVQPYFLRVESQAEKRAPNTGRAE